ncbi:hypothetical protein BC835DRAFT_1417357 [Cytidiella melzeri]|nr:hypothetical protein BC835DRAFT_1417357 [Cytidiella melzeri]
MDLHLVDSVVSSLRRHSICQLLITLLTNSRYEAHPQRHLFINEWPALLTTLAAHEDPLVRVATQEFARALVTKELTAEVSRLAEKESGWHISAVNARAEQFGTFTIDGMARRMQEQAPVLSTLLGALLNSDPTRTQRQRQFSEEQVRSAVDPSAVEMDVTWGEEDEYWCDADLDMLGPDVDDEAPPRGAENAAEGEIRSDAERKAAQLKKRHHRAVERRDALLVIRRVVVTSILTFSTNQQCNALAAVMGMFFHSTSTPELVVEVFAHAGLSLSLTTVHKMVNSLSKSANDELRERAKTKILAFAYDNFDMDFKSWSPTIDNPRDTLKHATSALAFPLEHDVTPEDLECCTALWNTNRLNPDIPREQHRSIHSWVSLITSPSPDRRDRTKRIFAWHFRHALIMYCKLFERFREHLGSPETIEQIPIKQTTHIPCRAMDINQSTADGQAEILENLFAQANIGDPTDTPNVEDIREYVVLVHGDLGTGERLDGSLASRAIERKPVRGLRNVVFVLGLFHLQMAGADAIWRMFIEPKAQRTEPNGLYQQACKIRPHDSGQIGSKPGFRLMHDLILQCAAARMLDIWRVEVEKHRSLEEYAASSSWLDLERMSLLLAEKYLDKSTAKDGEFRNNTLILGRLLDYVELTHAMKHGDIGRVENMFLCWVCIFKSVGKHKYASQLVKTMLDLKFIYPERLARHDGFRAVDWLVELMNLYIKVVYGSSGYARTFQLILKQSPLIEVFRRIHQTMQDNFHLLHRSVRHAPPDLTNTIQALCDLLRKNKAHKFDDSRKSYDLKHHMNDGLYLLQSTVTNKLSTEETAGEIEDIDVDDELGVDDLEADL